MQDENAQSKSLSIYCLGFFYFVFFRYAAEFIVQNIVEQPQFKGANYFSSVLFFIFSLFISLFQRTICLRVFAARSC